MGSTLISRRQDNKIVERLAALEEIVQSMRTNQSQKLIFGNITIDGSGAIATITVGNGNTVGVASKIVIGAITIEDDGNGNDTITLGIGNGKTSKIMVGNTITISDDGSSHGTITVNDGTNNRILIGYQQSGF